MCRTAADGREDGGGPNGTPRRSSNLLGQNARADVWRMRRHCRAKGEDDNDADSRRNEHTDDGRPEGGRSRPGRVGPDQQGGYPSRCATGLPVQNGEGYPVQRRRPLHGGYGDGVAEGRRSRAISRLPGRGLRGGARPRRVPRSRARHLHRGRGRYTRIRPLCCRAGWRLARPMACRSM